MKTALVLGAGGFIGGHLVNDLVRRGYWVRGADKRFPSYNETAADDFQLIDLREREAVEYVMDVPFDEVYQLAADMGGAGYIFTGEHDADVVHNSALINLHVARQAVKAGVGRLFFSSSACAYPEYNQTDPANPKCAEDTIYPAHPDSVYGWEKLFAEIMYKSFERNLGLDIRIARFHNIFGPFGAYENGREKAPAALCRKVAAAKDGGMISIWGTGEQTRSFLYIDECLEGVRRLMDSNCKKIINIGSEEMVSIIALADTIVEISGKRLEVHFDMTKPTGVAGRNSDNRLIREELGWAPSRPLREGLEKLYKWVDGRLHGNN